MSLTATLLPITRHNYKAFLSRGKGPRKREGIVSLYKCFPICIVAKQNMFLNFFLETFPEQRLLDSGCFPLIRPKISVRITGISYPRSRGFIFSTSQSNVRQEDNDSRYNQIFENFSPLISFPSPKFSGEWFELQKFNNSRILRKLYQEISVLFDPVSKSSGV